MKLITNSNVAKTSKIYIYQPILSKSRPSFSTFCDHFNCCKDIGEFLCKLKPVDITAVLKMKGKCDRLLKHSLKILLNMQKTDVLSALSILSVLKIES